MIAVLHNVRSLHNVGSIFRTADAAGITKLYLAGYTPAPVDEFGIPRGPLTKVALGAEKWVQWEKVASTSRLIDKLKKENPQYRVYAVEQHKNSVPLPKISLTKQELENAILVMGNEVKGLPPTILKRADVVVEIPMFGKKESLNVAVAFGVVAFSFVLQSHK